MRTIMLFLLAALVTPLGAAGAADYVYPGDREYIYCALGPEQCFIYCESPGRSNCPYPDTAYVFIRANDHLGFNRAHFRLEADYEGSDSVQAVIPCPGVAIESGDIREGMTISFPTLKTGHFKALILLIYHDAPNPLWNPGYVATRDCWLERTDYEILPLTDFVTNTLYPDCYMTHTQFYHPDTMDVLIGEESNLRVEWTVDGPYGTCGAFGGTDTQGWVLNYTPTYAWVTGCLTCPWHAETLQIGTLLPEDVPVGTLSVLTLSACGTSGNNMIVLRAVPYIAAEKQSWGKIKDLFR